MPCVRHVLANSDRPLLVQRVVQSLQRGELCVLPTETVYGIAMLPSHPHAAAAGRELKGRGDTQPYTWHLAHTADARRLVPTFSAGVERLVARYWPGPLTVLAPDGAGVLQGLRVPAHDFTREVIAACGEPLWLTSVNRHGEPPLRDAAAIEAGFGAGLAVIVDDGPSPLGLASTIVRQDTRRLTVLREGILGATEVLHTAANLVLFVCTGNTCRSPLAEALARELTAQKLGCAAADVLAHGIWFASAGTGTMDGMPASDGSLAVAAESQVDLTQHASRQVTRALVDRAGQIWCLAQSHRRALLAEFPHIAAKVRLLRPDALDVADPYGRDLPVYRRTRDEIRAVLQARLPEWLPA
ncbi:MAG: Sua5/YciO/YrdC/YwlC family protein [Planctomycetes bacterium]|nr:Sua5/YciO/YrdC/YwlC family protein [Planctomycetota bacterium]